MNGGAHDWHEWKSKWAAWCILAGVPRRVKGAIWRRVDRSWTEGGTSRSYWDIMQYLTFTESVRAIVSGDLQIIGVTKLMRQEIAAGIERVPPEIIDERGDE